MPANFACYGLPKVPRREKDERERERERGGRGEGGRVYVGGGGVSVFMCNG